MTKQKEKIESRRDFEKDQSKSKEDESGQNKRRIQDGASTSVPAHPGRCQTSNKGCYGPIKETTRLRPNKETQKALVSSITTTENDTTDIPTSPPTATPTRSGQCSILSYLTANSKLPSLQGPTAIPDATASNSNWVHDTSHLEEEDPILSPFGHDASLVDSSNKDSFRIYSKNILGLKFQAGDAFATEAVGFLASFNASAACLAETNTNWRHDESQNRIRDQFRMCCNGTRFAISNSGVKQESIYQPGGTNTAVMGKCCGMYKDSGINKQGSFLWVKMRGRRGRTVKVITCYRVSQDYGASFGESTAFIQQETILWQARINGSTLEHCISELISFITKATMAGEEVVLCMDVYAPMHGPRKGIQKLLSATGMVDAISQVHSDDAPKAYLQGRNLIYHMFVTPGIIPCIQRSGHLGIQDGIPSDHVGCWLESDGAELFRGSTENLETIQQKTFTMCDTEQLKIFTEKMETHLTIKQFERQSEEFKKYFQLGTWQRGISTMLASIIRMWKRHFIDGPRQPTSSLLPWTWTFRRIHECQGKCIRHGRPTKKE